MTTPKSLGQIAYEAHSEFAAEYGLWKSLTPEEHAIYERMASAVARAVKRREKGKKGA